MAYTPKEPDRYDSPLGISFADLLEDHPEVVSGQSDRDPYSNTEALNDRSRPLHPRR